MEKKTVYIDKEQMNELLDIPEDKTFAVDDNALIYDIRAEMWSLTVSVGTREEIEEAFTF